MKKILITLIAVTLYISGSSQKYFEGTVEYEISFESSNPGITENLLKDIFGAKVKFHLRDGTYMRDYVDENGNSLRKFIYNAPENRLFIVSSADPDTVYYSDASEKLFDNYTITKGKTETILDCACPSKVIRYRYYEKAFKDTVNTKLEYFFCHKIAVNPDYYKNYYIWSDIIKEEKSLAIKFTEETEGYFKIIYTAKKIEPKTLQKEIFDIDKKAFLVKQSL
jgi:hypothetical protein